MSTFRGSDQILPQNLVRALPNRKPETFAEKQANRMFTHGGSPHPNKQIQQGPSFCSSCGTSHRLGTVCSKSVDKSYAQLTAELNAVVKGVTMSSNKRGNPAHDSDTGQFTSSQSAAASHAKGEVVEPKRGATAEGKQRALKNKLDQNKQVLSSPTASAKDKLNAQRSTGAIKEHHPAVAEAHEDGEVSVSKPTSPMRVPKKTAKVKEEDVVGEVRPSDVLPTSPPPRKTAEVSAEDIVGEVRPSDVLPTEPAGAKPLKIRSPEEAAAEYQAGELTSYLPSQKLLMAETTRQGRSDVPEWMAESAAHREAPGEEHPFQFETYYATPEEYAQSLQQKYSQAHRQVFERRGMPEQIAQDHYDDAVRTAVSSGVDPDAAHAFAKQSAGEVYDRYTSKFAELRDPARGNLDADTAHAQAADFALLHPIEGSVNIPKYTPPSAQKLAEFTAVAGRKRTPPSAIAEAPAPAAPRAATSPETPSARAPSAAMPSATQEATEKLQEMPEVLRPTAKMTAAERPTLSVPVSERTTLPEVPAVRLPTERMPAAAPAEAPEVPSAEEPSVEIPATPSIAPTTAPTTAPEVVERDRLGTGRMGGARPGKLFPWASYATGSAIGSGLGSAGGVAAPIAGAGMAALRSPIGLSTSDRRDDANVDESRARSMAAKELAHSQNETQKYTEMLKQHNRALRGLPAVQRPYRSDGFIS